MTNAKSIILAENSTEFSSWQMPEIKDGQIVHAEKTQQRGSRGELVKVDPNEIIYNSITAGQLEEINNQAYEDVRARAYEEGHQQGYRDGVSAGQQAILKQTAALNDVLQQLSSVLGEQDDQLEQALVNLVVCVSQCVLRRELTIDSSNIMQVVTEAVGALPIDSKNIQVFLNEQDYQLLSSNSSSHDNVLLQVDSTLSSGGCRVSTQHSLVDFTLEEQFNQTINRTVEEQFSLLSRRAKERSEENNDSETDIAPLLMGPSQPVAPKGDG